MDQDDSVRQREIEIERDLSILANLLEDDRGPVELKRTHGSLVFLTQASVYKLKRAVDFGFFDFTTREAREHDCREELRLNRRLAPSVYRAVLPVFRDAAGYSLVRDGGDVDDHVVHMRRLPDAANASSRLEAGRLGIEDLDVFARRLAEFYRCCPKAAPAFDALLENFEENFRQCAAFDAAILPPERLATLRAGQEAWLRRHESILRQRPSRDGHGDLRLEHAYLLEDGPTFIDCIAFNERFRIADPALDVAFLAMELVREGRRDLAEAFLGAFAYECDDYDAYPLFDGYLSYRATVRGKVAAFVAADSATIGARRDRKAEEARRHFELAQAFLDPGAARGGALIAMFGLPASGKSTVARRLRALAPVAIISADATRKHLVGRAKHESAGADAYTAEVSERTRCEMLRRAGCVLDAGRTAVLDTTFRRRADRDQLRTFAADRGVSLRFVECTAPLEVLRQRIRDRSADVSDADEDVLEAFVRDHDPCGEDEAAQWTSIDTTDESADIDARLTELVRP